jgi:hypothetical protein
VSGPKCLEIAYVRLAQARRCNRAHIGVWLATYTRLFGELAAHLKPGEHPVRVVRGRKRSAATRMDARRSGRQQNTA